MHSGDDGDGDDGDDGDDDDGDDGDDGNDGDDTLGFSLEEKQNAFKLTASIAHLGEMT